MIGRGYACMDGRSRVRVEYRRPQVVFGVQSVNLGQLDLGTVRGAVGAGSNPPLGSWKACGRVRPRPRILLLVGGPWLGDNLPVRWLPQPDRTVVSWR